MAILGNYRSNSNAHIQSKGFIMRKHLSYKVFLQKEPEGGYTVTVPALQGCVTYGENIDHAMEMAKEAIELYLESLSAHGEEVPSDDNKLEYTITLPTNA